MNRAIYRIIDANYNRAREGLRVVEEFCRFALDNKQLSGRCKEIRHKLSGLVAKFDSQKLIASRDTENDVGCGMKISEPMRRASLEDCVTAGLARTVEAIRAITEAAYVMDRTLAGEIEKLRYDCYMLEKDISLFGFPSVKFSKVMLYCILTMKQGVDVLRLAEQCCDGGADCLQLRAKDISDDRFCSIAKKFVKICKQKNMISIINDRADIAIAAEADGVHLGQNDMPASEIRRMQLKPLIIGKSTHSMAELAKAVEEKPHYVGVGCVFPTVTKNDVEICGTKYVGEATEFLKDQNIEAVAIGGITQENIDKVLKAGAKRIAVSSLVCEAKNPAEVCRELKNKIEAFNIL